MKKNVLLMILFLLPLCVFADTCNTIKDTQTGNDRVLVCDKENKTTTTYTTTTSKQVLKNDVCTITCTEEILVSIDPIKKVLAGTSFNYPLYISGERKCTAVYNYDTYEKNIRNYISGKVTSGSTVGGNLGGVTTGQVNMVTAASYYKQKKKCDNFFVEDNEYYNEYKYDADVELEVETSEKRVTIPYKFQNIDEPENTVIIEEAPYQGACNYNEETKTCDGATETIAGWTETSRIFGKYTMDDTYIERYTGEVKDVESEDTCNVGDRFFVSLTEYTKPLKDDALDNGYSLKLTARDIGNNLGIKNLSWNLDVSCWYQVKNLTFPQNDVGVKKDEYYDEIGSTGFIYRLIDLSDPFPNRTPNANWVNKEQIILSTKDKLSSLARFEINLSRSSIQNIRSYNEVHSYEPFNIEIKDVFDSDGNKTGFKEYSSFIEAFNTVIDRK